MVEAVRSIADPVARWRELNRLKKDIAVSRRALSRLRKDTVDELRELRDDEHPEGWSLTQIGKLTGETRSTIQYVADGRGLARETDGE